MGARVRCTGVKLYGAVHAGVGHIANTPVAIDEVNTVAMATRTGSTIIVVHLTVVAYISRSTDTGVVVESIDALCAVLTRIRVAFVDVKLTALATIARHTATHVAIDGIDT